LDITSRLHLSFCTMLREMIHSNGDIYINLDNFQQRHIFLESMRLGAKKYLCYDDNGNLYNTNDAVNYCINQVCSCFKMDRGGSSINADQLISELAKKMTAHYVIKWQDRRKIRERRVDQSWSLN
jgi:hypothetical protein